MKKLKEVSGISNLGFICTLFVIITALVGIICYKKGIHEGATKGNVYLPSKYELHEIKNIDTLKELSTHVDVILGSTIKNEEYNQAKTFIEKDFNFKILQEVLEKQDQERIVFKNTKEKELTDSEYAKIKNEIKESKEDITIIDKEDIINKSIDLFGEKINHETKEFNSCEKYIYLEDKYYKINKHCKNHSLNYIKSYKTKITEDNQNKAYVDIVFAYLVNDGEDLKYNIYRMFNRDNNKIDYSDLYTKNNKDTNNINFNITKENNEDFLKYKFIFNKASNGNYYFTSLELPK